MPAYLCHGFRWHRPSIRVFVVVQNIDEAAPEWIIAPESSNAILRSFYELFDFLPDARRDGLEDRQRRKMVKSRKRAPSRGRPENTLLLPGLSDGDLALPPPSVPPEEDDVLVNDWSAVKLLEEYDPADLTAASRPYAFVADHVVRVDLNVSVVEEMARYEERMAGEPNTEKAMLAPSSDDYKNKTSSGKKSSSKKTGWLEKLRDQLQQGEDIRWYVVACGDEERRVDQDLLEESRVTRVNPTPQPKREEEKKEEKELEEEQQQVMTVVSEPAPEALAMVKQHSRTASRDKRPRGRERSVSNSKRMMVPGAYSPFPPAAQPQPVQPPVLRKPSLGSMALPRPPTREGGPLGSHPQASHEQFPGVRPPQKTGSLRRLFSRRGESS